MATLFETIAALFRDPGVVFLVELAILVLEVAIASWVTDLYKKLGSSMATLENQALRVDAIFDVVFTPDARKKIEAAQLVLRQADDIARDAAESVRRVKKNGS